MLEWLNSTWTRWKVQVSFVGGALVVATAYGTCVYEPQDVSDAGEISSAITEIAGENTSVEVSVTTVPTETHTGTSNEGTVTTTE